MRVLILGDSVFVPVRRLVDLLIAEGHEVHLATFGRDDVPAPAQTHRIRHRGRLGLLLARRTASRWVASLRPDIVHAFYLTSYGFLASDIRDTPVLVSASVTTMPATRKGTPSTIVAKMIPIASITLNCSSVGNGMLRLRR